MISKFYAAEFAEQDYLLLYSSTHPHFNIPLPALSADEPTMTVEGQPFSVVLSRLLFDMGTSLDPDMHSSFLGYLGDVVSHPFSFFQLYCKLLNENKAQAVLEGKSLNLTLMTGKLNLFIIHLDKNNIVPTIDISMRWYGSVVTSEFEKANDPCLSDKEKKAILKSSIKKFKECIRATKLMLKAFQRAVEDADSRIVEIIHHEDGKNHDKYFYITNEPKDFAQIIAQMYYDLEFTSFPGENDTRQKIFVERMRLAFRNEYSTHFDKRSLIVMVNQALQQIKKVLTNKGLHLLLLNEVLSDLVDLFV